MENDKTKDPARENKMEERYASQHVEDEIDLGEYFSRLRPNLWKIVLFSVTAGFVTLILMFQFPNTYQATAVITPAFDEKKQNPAFSALASFGFEIGGPSRIEDLETLFKSNDLAVRVFRKYNLWPIVLPDRFDSATGTLKKSWTDRLFGEGNDQKPPGDWDAIRAVKYGLMISPNKKSGTVSISFETPTAEESANIVKYYLEEGKSRLQEEAFERAVKNKKFIEEQIGRTVDALTRDRLYSLYGQEVEREMMARNREQFGFRVIDAPRVPDRKFKPRRGQWSFIAFLLSFFVGCLFFIIKGHKKREIHIANQAESHKNQ